MSATYLTHEYLALLADNAHLQFLVNEADRLRKQMLQAALDAHEADRQAREKLVEEIRALRAGQGGG